MSKMKDHLIDLQRAEMDTLLTDDLSSWTYESLLEFLRYIKQNHFNDFTLYYAEWHLLPDDSKEIFTCTADIKDGYPEDCIGQEQGSCKGCSHYKLVKVEDLPELPF